MIGGIENGMLYGGHREPPPDGSGDPCQEVCNAAYLRSEWESDDLCYECGKRFCPECAQDLTRAEGRPRQVCESCAAKIAAGQEIEEVG